MRIWRRSWSKRNACCRWTLKVIGTRAWLLVNPLHECFIFHLVFTLHVRNPVVLRTTISVLVEFQRMFYLEEHGKNLESS